MQYVLINEYTITKRRQFIPLQVKFILALFIYSLLKKKL